MVRDQGTRGKATIRYVDGASYVKGDRAFWKASSTDMSASDRALMATLADKWVKTPTSAGKLFDQLTSRTYLDGVLGPSALSASDLAAAPTIPITERGQDALLVTTSGRSFTFNAETKYPMLIEGEQLSPDTSGTGSLDGWNQQPVVTAPAGAIDLGR